MKIQLILLLIFIVHIFSKADNHQEEAHKFSRYPFIAVSDNGEVTIISPEIASDKSLASQYDKKAEIISEDKALNPNFPSNSKVVIPHSTEGNNPGSYIILYTNKTYDVIATYSQGRVKYTKSIPHSKAYIKKSLVALKNGKILSAGIVEDKNNNKLAEIDVNLYDPQTNTFGTGLSFGINGKFISCYEQKENQVYCAYVVQQYPFVSKLMLQHMEVNPTAKTVTSKGEQIIKTFYTTFNFIKAVPYKQEEAIILFRTGDGNSTPRYGNDGTNLFYYHIKPTANANVENLVSVVRYDFLSELDCRFRKGDNDESIDIGVLSENKVFIACETNSGKLKGFILNPKKQDFEEFNFYNFDAKDIRNPVFAKFDKSMGIFYTYISEDGNNDVNFHLMSYPDCRNISENKIKLIPRKYSLTDIDFYGKVFMINPYLASKMSDKNYVKFGPYSGVLINNTKENKTIEAGKVYDSENL